MADFLLELLSEEIPARMQAKAAKDLAFLVGEALLRAGLPLGEAESFATPRRLALIVRGLPLQTDPLSDEIKGPRTSAPPQALEGFLRKTGLAKEALVERDGVWFATIATPGRDTREVLAEAIPAIVRGFPWPKSMRWGAASASTASLRWVRPLKGIVALLGEELVECEVDGVRSGAATVGHRFHHPGIITIGSAEDYAAKLRACHVVLDPAERMAIIRDGARVAAAAAGLTLVEDEALVAENAGLTEWPVPLLGRFDPAFLDVPREVIQLTMRTNQKYFACTDGEGRLAPAFVCTANIDAADGGAAIVAGNAKVLAARLADARFFWEQDLKVSLAEQAKKLDRIVFHEKLGTVADKAARVAKLARWLVEEGIVPPRGAFPGEGRGPASSLGAGSGVPASAGTREQMAQMADDAARLCKADLVTGMVGEFPELQGVMGGYYGRAEGLPDEVADAIRDHYKPVGQGDEVPTAPVTVAVSLADKLDTIAAFFRIEAFPTGSRDPFALRRSALGIIRLLDQGLRLPLRRLLENSLWQLERQIALEALGAGGGDGQGFGGGRVELPRFIIDFFADRLKVQQREASVRHDLIDAVFALGGEDDLVRLLARVKALQAFVETDEGRDLLAGYKRAANILKREGWGEQAPSLLRGEGWGEGSPQRMPPDSGPSPNPLPGGERAAPVADLPPAEAALVAALDAAEPRAADAVAREDFAEAMRALATLRAPIDAFFDAVTVNDPDRAVRARRLDLLARIRAAVHGVADFSRIEG